MGPPTPFTKGWIVNLKVSPNAPVGIRSILPGVRFTLAFVMVVMETMAFVDGFVTIKSMASHTVSVNGVQVTVHRAVTLSGAVRRLVTAVAGETTMAGGGSLGRVKVKTKGGPSAIVVVSFALIDIS
jgi:hypothetical protein